MASVGINTGGSQYKVNDEIVFDDANSSGYRAKASVNLIEGKIINQISVANTEFSNVEFILGPSASQFVGYTTIPHNFHNAETVYISGLSTTGIKNNSDLLISRLLFEDNEGNQFFFYSHNVQLQFFLLSNLLHIFGTLQT